MVEHGDPGKQQRTKGAVLRIPRTSQKGYSRGGISTPTSARLSGVPIWRQPISRFSGAHQTLWLPIKAGRPLPQSVKRGCHISQVPSDHTAIHTWTYGISGRRFGSGFDERIPTLPQERFSTLSATSQLN